jgi:hypothetical protein
LLQQKITAQPEERITISLILAGKKEAQGTPTKEERPI